MDAGYVDWPLASGAVPARRVLRRGFGAKVVWAWGVPGTLGLLVLPLSPGEWPCWSSEVDDVARDIKRVMNRTIPSRM